MTTYNTGNPIGSTDARDRLDNSENMDILENSTTLNEHPDRLGTMRKTRKGMELEHDNQIAAHEAEHDAQIAAHETEHDNQIAAHEAEHDAQIAAHETEHDNQIAAHESEHDAKIAAHETEHDNQMQSFENDFDSRLAGMAFTRVGTFTTGATLTDMRQTLLWEISQGGDGHEYGWTGSFLPSGKVVSAGSTPETTGGIGTGAWVDRTDVVLRDQLAATDGDSIIGYATYAQIRAYTGDKKSIRCGGRASVYSGDGANGKFYRDDTDTTSADNDGTVLVDALNRRWKRVFTGDVSVAWFGAKGDNVANDTTPIESANNVAVSAKKRLYFPAGTYNYTQHGYSFVNLAHHYWVGENSQIVFQGNGVAFDVKCSFDKTIRCIGMRFTVANPTTNNNVTGFYLHNGTAWGSSFYFEDCEFIGMTNCSVHAIRAFRFGAKNTTFYGSSIYSDGSGLLPKNDAGVRLWGADGTLTVQDHSFSNLGEFDNCLFGKCKFGIDGWGVINCNVRTSTFEPGYIGIINRRRNNFCGIGSSTEKCGWGVGNMTLSGNWFEQLASFAFCGVDIDPNDGSEPAGQLVAVFYGTDKQYFTDAQKKHSSTIVGAVSEQILAYINRPDTSKDLVLLYGFTNNPDAVHFKFSTKSAMVRPTLQLTNGLQFAGGASVLNHYEEGTFTPQLYIGETSQGISQDGIVTKYTRIGNIVHVNFSMFTNTYAKAGTGNVQIRGLPFVANGTAGIAGSMNITAMSVLTAATGPYGVMVPGSSILELKKSDLSRVTDANIVNTSTLQIVGAGWYYV